MANTTRRDAVDTEGLVVVKRAIEPDPKAECVGHFPTHVVESRHEIVDGETVGELLARIGLDEGDTIEIRWPTMADDRAKLRAALDPACHRTNVRPTARRDAKGAPLDRVHWEHWPEAEAR